MRSLPFLVAAAALVNSPFVLSTDGWQIRTVSIDNPTQAWVYIDTVNQYLPPQSIGRILSIDPGSQRVTGRFVAAPAGGVPSVFTPTDPPLSGMMYDADLNDSPGMDYSLVPAINNLLVGINALTAAIDNLQGGYGAARQAPTRVAFSDSVAGWVDPVIPAGGIRQLLYLSVASDIAIAGIMSFGFVDGGGTTYQRLTISPQTPFVDATFPLGTFEVPAGLALNMTPTGAGNFTLVACYL